MRLEKVVKGVEICLYRFGHGDFPVSLFDSEILRKLKTILRFGPST